MENGSSRSKRKATANPDRWGRCVFCKDRITLTDAMQNAGVCRLCASEIAEFGWRTIYDREQKVGEIPPNLRIAYKL